jgi:hypothetical protein
MGKSTRQRALHRAREAAKSAGLLHEFYIARDIAKVASRREFVPSPVVAGQYPGMPGQPLRATQIARKHPSDATQIASEPTYAPQPDFAVRTIDGASWPADETGYSKYMKWNLPTQVASPRGRY